MAFSEFRPVDEKSLIKYIKATPALSNKIRDKFDDLKIKEVGDGNLNFVYIVVGSHGSFVIEQALPYIRCIEESWAMTKERAYFESLTLKEHDRFSPEHVPKVYHFVQTGNHEDTAFLNVIVKQNRAPYLSSSANPVSPPSLIGQYRGGYLIVPEKIASRASFETIT